MRIFAVCFILILALSQCTLPTSNDKKISSDLMPAETVHKKGGDKLYQVWEVIGAEHPLPKDLFNYGDTSGVFNYPGLVFLNDSEIVENPRGEIRFGKFTVNDKKIVATFMDGRESIYLIGALHDDYLYLQRKEDGRKTVLTLKADGINYADARKNPFDISYNQWRIKPVKEEDTAALKKRLKQYIEFYVVFFNDVLQKEANQINFEGLPCCFNWYKGGIYIQSEKNLDLKFMRCFYSKKQAFIARQILEDALRKKYNWVKGEPNWIKQTAPVLQQIRDSI